MRQKGAYSAVRAVGFQSFHGGNTGSNPVGDANNPKDLRELAIFAEGLKGFDGFIAMPGEFDTLDELFEIATLIQTGKIQRFPVVLMGTQNWSPLLDFLRQTVVEGGALDAADLSEMLVTDSSFEAVSHIERCAIEQFGLHFKIRRAPSRLFLELAFGTK